MKTLSIKGKQILYTIIEGIFAFLLLLFVILLFRLMVAPISLNFIRPQLTGTLKEVAQVDSVYIDNIYLDIGNRSIFPQVAVSGLRLFSSIDSASAFFSKSYFSIKIISLWKGEIEPTSVEIYDSEIVLTQKTFELYFQSYEADTTITKSLEQSITDISKGVFSFFELFPEFNSFVLENFTIRFILDNEVSEFSIDNIDIYVNKKTDIETLDKLKSFLNPDTTWIEADIKFSKFPFHLLHNFVPTLSSLAGSSIFLDGKVGLKLDDSANLIEFSYQLNALNSKIYYASLLERLPLIKHFNLVGKIGNQFNYFDLVDLSFITDKERFKVTGRIDNFSTDPIIRAGLEITNLSLSRVKNYWPLHVEANTREWITTHIYSGMISRTIGDFSTNRDNGSPEIEYNIHFNFDSVIVDHSPPMIPPKFLKGTGSFTKEGLIVKDVTGSIHDSDINNAAVKIFGIGTDSTGIEISGSVVGPATDLVNIIYSANVDTLFEMRGGTAETQIALVFPLGPTPPFAEMEVHAVADIKGTEIVDISGFHISNSNVTAKYQNGAITIDGDVGIDGLPVKIQYDYHLFNDNPMIISGQAILAPKDFSIFSIPDIPLLKGKGLAKAKVVIASNYTGIYGSMDLKDYQVDLEQIGIKKKRGQAGRFDIDIILRPEKGLEISDWVFSSSEYFGRGSAFLGTTNDKIKFMINADSVHFGRNNLSLVYKEYWSNAFEIHAHGKSFDLAPILSLEKESMKDTTEISDKKQRFELTVDLDTVYVENNIYYNDIIAEASIGKSVIPEFGLKGVYDRNKEFQLFFNTGKYQKKFFFGSDDAGIIFQGTGIDSSIHGGQLTVSSDLFFDNPESKYTIGKIKFENIRVINANAIAKLFALASLDGISNSVSKEGVIFDRMESDFKIEKQVIYLQNGLVKSSAIGITFDGQFNIPRSLMYIKGTLIPVNFANSILSNVPILSTLVDDGGIFAFNYTLKGKAGNPDITVNPFSIVTPGITRKVFDIFESKPDSIDN